MRWKLILTFIFCLASTTLAGLNPANSFSNWPWSSYTNQFWQDVESTNHIVKQLMLAISDRAKPVSLSNLTDYQKYYILYAGIKTNYSYITNIGTNYYTNHPQIKLSLSNYTDNTFGYYSYLYPSNAGNPSTTYVTATGVVYLTKDICDWINNGIISLSSNYLAITNDPATFFGTAPYPMTAPGFTMSNLLVSAGFGNNCTGVIWHWQTELPSNGVVTLKALDERAACLAQMRYLRIPGKACTPWFYFAGSASGPHPLNVENITSPYMEVDGHSFAWRQREQTGWPTDPMQVIQLTKLVTENQYSNVWTNSIAVNFPNDPWNKIDVGEPNEAWLYSGYIVTNPPDWSHCGWMMSWVVFKDFYIERTNWWDHTNWVICSTYDELTDDLYHPADDIFVVVTGNTYSVNQIYGIYNQYTPYEYSTRIISYWTNAAYDYAPYYSPYYYGDSSYEKLVTNSDKTATTISNVVISTKPSTTNTLYTWGYYQTHTNNQIVNFTNLCTNGSFRIPQTNITYKSWTNYLYYDITYTNIPDPYWGLMAHQGQWQPYAPYNKQGAQLNNGSFTFHDLNPINYGDQIRLKAYSYKPDIFALYTNVASTCMVFAIGGKISENAEWRKDSYDRIGGNVDVASQTIYPVAASDWEWHEDYFDGIDLSKGYAWAADVNIFTNPPTLYTNRYAQLASYNTLSSIDSSNMIYYTGLYFAAMNEPWVLGYYPFDTFFYLYPRSFWGVKDLIWIQEFVFPINW